MKNKYEYTNSNELQKCKKIEGQIKSNDAMSTKASNYGLLYIDINDINIM